MGWVDQDSLPVTLSTQMEKIIHDEPIMTGEGVLHHKEGVDLIPANIELSGMEMSLVNAARADAEEEIDRFIDWWKLQAAQTKPLRYYVVGTERYNRLMNPYDQPHDENEKATLRSMREVESSANMFYYTED